MTQALKEHAEATTRSLIEEIVARDVYKLRSWHKGFFDTFVDIGANVGIFVGYALERNPEASVLACEPGRIAYLELEKEYATESRVTLADAALGDGGDLFFYCPSDDLICTLFYKSEEKDKSLVGYPVKSFTLRDMLSAYNIVLGGNYYIKIDCEGGERFLLDDPGAVSVLKGAKGASIEIHAKSPVAALPDVIDRFGNFPSMKTYQSWAYDNFSDTHDILFHTFHDDVNFVVCLLMSKDRAGRV